ncbi:MAG: molybdopterin synthase sulfur carrier subunit [Micrococcales bacterium]|nr:MAG: molybdopterin synthase sulfur carrier subunit [Micrococcales bacterium]
MEITVDVPAVLRSKVDGRSSVPASGSSLREIFDDLAMRYPDFTSSVRPEGRLAGFVNVYVGATEARINGGLNAPVAAGDHVSVVMAVAGG